MKIVICFLRALKSRDTFNELYEKGFIRKKYSFREIFKKECELYATRTKKKQI